MIGGAFGVTGSAAAAASAAAIKSTGHNLLLQKFWHSIVGVRGPSPTPSSGSASSASSSSRFPHHDPLLSFSSARGDSGADIGCATSSTSATSHYDSSSSPLSTSVQIPHQRLQRGNFGWIPKHPIEEIAQHKLVFLGEIHSMPPIIAFQREVQRAMTIITATTVTGSTHPSSDAAAAAALHHRRGNLHVIMEHFSFELQGLLDEYMSDRIDFETLVEKYHQLGDEKHDLQPYKQLFEDAKWNNLNVNTEINGDSSDTISDDNNRYRRHVHLHAGFLPRRFARMLLKDGEDVTLQAASKWLPPRPKINLHGSDFHYNVFESLLSGRSIYSNQLDRQDDADDGDDRNTTTSEANHGPSDQFRRIFKAQVLKDEAMAHRISTLIRDSGDDCNDDKFLVIAGNGHLLHYTGVPERVLRDNPHLADDTCLVISESAMSEMFTPGDHIGQELPEQINNAITPCEDSSKSGRETEETDPSKISSYLQRRFGHPGSNPADYIFLYETPDEVIRTFAGEISDGDAVKHAAAVKEETKNAYDKVGNTAGFTGNSLKAAWIMYNLGYSEHDYQTAGPDAYNFQGVGNPHRHATIQKREIVLDVGCGLGIDSIIASDAVGPDGLVIGIDLSEKEITHAQKRAKERDINNLKFLVGDMENMKQIPDNSIDVIISNGAFCLAPNKERAFAELYRVLRPGGRISVCTTTVQNDNLEPGVSWPLCMKMFIAKGTIKPMCERLGFVDVVVDDSDSRMSMDIPEQVLEQSNPARNSIHIGGEEFKHLEGYDMDEICARVCVVARKPL